jgi:hypothetical protein
VSSEELYWMLGLVLYQGPTLVGPQRIERNWALAPAIVILQKMLLKTIHAGAKARILVVPNGPTKVGP